MLLLRLAWRNLWRNTRRTLITMSALTLGVLAIVFLQSFQEATFAQMLRAVTTGLMGHLQIHGRGYQESPEMSNVVRQPEQVEAVLAGKLPGSVTERRVVAAGLAGVGERSAPAMVLGVTPGGATRLRTVVEGQDLSPAAGHEVVLGRGLAEELEAKVGSELVIVGQAADGSVANDRYTVVGLATTDSSEMDLRAIFLHLQDAQELFALGDGVHQIVVRLPTDAEDLTEPMSVVRGALDLATLEAMSWSEMIPELEGVIDQKRKGVRSIGAVVFLIVALGVLNAMTMSTFERTREFGVMASVGTRPRRILGLVVTEALIQGVVSLALGLFLAWVALTAVGDISVPFSGQDVVAGVRMPTGIPLTIQWEAVKTATLTAVFTMLAGGLIPAFRAARLRPADATRRT